MKRVIILGDGMADEPIEELGGKTPLQYAETPTFDWLAKHSRMGMLKTVPAGYHPGSEVANMAVLGYDLDESFEGRGSLEAASMGIDILPGEMAMRCNIICIENGLIKNHSAGHISNEEAKVLIDYLNEKLGDERVSFYPGVSYRHLLKIKDGCKAIECTPPHDVPGTPFKDVLVRACSPEAEATAELINSLIIKSQKLLSEHPVNLKRISEGKDPANSIWPWSPGYRPKMQTLQERFGIGSGAVISAVDLIRGIGLYAGLKPIIVDGATGLWNTNYKGKAEAAVKAMKETDFVFVHVEASDEAGHEGDVALKVKTVESLDRLIAKPILEAANSMDEPVAIAVLPDHPTPCRLRTHSANPVPFMIYRNGITPDGIDEYNETSAQNGSYGTLDADEFIKEFFKI
ncbi:MAG: cofactor-independent phosphoglycerate mutase [Bacteroidales bacterium]|nr:cofactor-independent phosphoglycerate mutase [Bacteroidales bacterium]